MPYYFSFLTSTTSGIDTSLIDSIIGVMETILSSFTIFPLNVCMAGFVIGIVIGVFRKLKRS